VPTAISTLIFTFFLLTFYTVPQPHRGGYSAPKAGAFGTLAYSLFSMVLSLPVGIITTRFVGPSQSLTS
jgi:ABC-type phosphate transport system permease subunit